MRQQHQRNHQRRRAVAAAVLSGTLVVAGCGSGSKPASESSSTAVAAGTASSVTSTSVASSGVQGVTPTTITLGQVADVSGPIPGLFSGAVNGMDAWAGALNAAGGIDGRKVIIDHKDSALNCDTYTTSTKSLATSVFALVGTFSLEDECGLATLQANPSLSDIEASLLSPSLFPLPNVFAPIPQPPGWATTEYQWVKDHFGAAAIAKTADLYSAASAANFEEERAAAESIGYDYVYTRGYAATETNFTADILRMKADGVKVVGLVSDAVGVTADFLQQAAQQDFHPEAVINTTAYDPTFFKLVGDPADATSLVLSLRESMYLGEDSADVPEITTMTNWLARTHPGAPMNLFVVEAFSAGLLFQAAMSGAGANPTQASLASAVRGVHAFDADGLITETDPGNKVPPVCNLIAGVRNGKFVRIDPPTKGFECNGTFHPYPASP